MYSYAPQYIENNISSTSFILRPEDTSSTDVKPFLRVVPIMGWQSHTCHLWRVLCQDEEDVSGTRCPGEFSLLLLVVEAKREDQVLSAKSFENN